MSEIIDLVVIDEVVDLVVTNDAVDVTIRETIVDVVGVAEAGPQGATGPPGPPGFGAYTHSQGVPAAVWTIAHNLGFRPNVDVFDSAGSPAEGTVSHVDDNNLTITFTSGGSPASFGGVAYLS